MWFDAPMTDKLIETPSFYDEHWVGMPEFVQHKKEAFATIIVRVESQYDLDALAAALGQKLTRKTKSAWYPFKSHWRNEVQPVWTNES